MAKVVQYIGMWCETRWGGNFGMKRQLLASVGLGASPTTGSLCPSQVGSLLAHPHFHSTNTFCVGPTGAQKQFLF